ncbi:hypothetical protein O4K05_002531 [Salmonella enterica]|nr:hypothetical protein [Salmonella enterica]
MITTLFIDSEEPLICAAGMPVCGGKLVSVYFGDLRGHPWRQVTHWAWIAALPELLEED